MTDCLFGFLEIGQTVIICNENKREPCIITAVNFTLSYVITFTILPLDLCSTPNCCDEEE